MAAEKIAVVTGASSGLGREYVARIDESEQVDEIWIIARRRERLEETAAATHHPVRILCADLATREGIERVIDALTAHRPDIRLLVSAAGFGKIGSYRDIALEEVDRMIDLNCRGAVDMTQICLPYMSRGARILEICSTAAFSPLPSLNVYAASKSFLYRYSRALGIELLPEGITVTAVCPYWIRDTEFIPVAQRGADASAIRSFPFSSRAADVVRLSLNDSRLGLGVSTPGIVCSLHRLIAHITSSRLQMAGWELLRRLRIGSRD